MTETFGSSELIHSVAPAEREFNWSRYFSEAIEACVLRYELDFKKQEFGISDRKFDANAEFYKGQLILDSVCQRPGTGQIDRFGWEDPHKFQKGDGVVVSTFRVKPGDSHILSRIEGETMHGRINYTSEYMNGEQTLEIKSSNVPSSEMLGEALLSLKKDTYPNAAVKRHDILKNFQGYIGWVKQDPVYGAESFYPVTSKFLENDFEPNKLSPDAPKINHFDAEQNEIYGRAMEIEQNPVLFLQGPPGSGKSTVITHIIAGHLKEKRTVAIVSHSNKGAQIPALMLPKAMSNRKAAMRKVFVAGNDAAVIHPSLRKRRIKKDVPVYPQALVAAVNALDDWQIEEDLKNRGARQVSRKDVFAERKYLRKQVLEPYEKALVKAENNLGQQLEKGGLIVSTFGTLLNDQIVASQEIDVVIVDEATRMEMPDFLLALERAGKQIIFVGDPLQLGNLPPEPGEQKQLVDQLLRSVDREVDITSSRTMRVINEKAESAWESPFSEIILGTIDPEKTLPFVMLRHNRRSQPNIVKLLSDLIYDGKLKVDENIETENEGKIVWFDTSDLGAKENTSGTSKKNSGEADLIVDHILNMTLNKGYDPSDIGVIATYKDQAELIKKRLIRKIGHSKKTVHKHLCRELVKSIATVDAFQGDERRVIFVSMTRSNEEGLVGFLDEQRRMGVAVGRAKEELYIYGDKKTLTTARDSDAAHFFNRLATLVDEYGMTESVSANKLSAVRSGSRKRRHKRFA